MRRLGLLVVVVVAVVLVVVVVELVVSVVVLVEGEVAEVCVPEDTVKMTTHALGRFCLLTDGASNFHEAYMKELKTNRYTSPAHIQEIRTDGKVHNNKMKRMNEEIRDREKVVRSLKDPETPILTGYQIFHNYIRPHMALDNRTPADVAGIEVRGKNKWLTLIQNASKAKR